MKLQARFGTDSRFQIDSRFLESDDETEEKGNLWFIWVLDLNSRIIQRFQSFKLQMTRLQKKMQKNNFLKRKRKV